MRSSCMYVFALFAVTALALVEAGSAGSFSDDVTPSRSLLRKKGQKRREVAGGPTTRWLEGLRPMPANHGPESDDWSNSFAICAIMRDENITDIYEWIEYYQWLGVDHIFLTDNNSHNSKWLINQLTAAFPDTLLTARRDTMPRAQLKTYAWCAEEYRWDYNWMAFFDLDEIMVIRDQVNDETPDLKGFMDQYKNEAGLAVNWVPVGPSGRGFRPTRGGMMAYYDQCYAKADKHIKTIVNTYYLEGVALHPHGFHYLDEKVAVDEGFRPLPEVLMPKPINVNPDKWTQTQCNTAFNTGGEDDEELVDHCFRTAEPLNREGTVEKVALFHYATKSASDFRQKIARGSGMSERSKTFDYFSEVLNKQKEDPMCNEPKILAEKCCCPTDGCPEEKPVGDMTYYMSIKYITKKIHTRVRVYPSRSWSDPAVMRALAALSIVLATGLCVMLGMLALTWLRRARNKASKA